VPIQTAKRGGIVIHVSLLI